MPRGDKSSYADKQKRQAAHIEEGYERKGISKKTAQQRAWATVNKEDGGGKKGGAHKSPAKKTARKRSTGSLSSARRTVRHA